MPVKRLAQISTNHDVLAALPGEEAPRIGTLEHREGETFFKDAKTGESTLVDVTGLYMVENVTQTRDPDSDDAMPDEQERLVLRFEPGYRYHWGNKDRGEAYVTIGLDFDSPDLDVENMLSVDVEGDSDFPRFLLGASEWRFGDESGLRPLALVEVDRDTAQGLGFRGRLGIGAGKQLLSRGQHSLDGSLDLGYEYEQYDAKYLEQGQSRWRDSYRRWWHDGSSDEDELNLRLHPRYRVEDIKGFDLEDRLSLYPSLTDSGDFRARYRSSVAYALNENLALKLQLQVDYEADPELDSVDKWQTYLGAGINWGF